MNALKKLTSKLKNRQKTTYKISEDAAMEQICDILEYYDINMELLESSNEMVETQGENLIQCLIKYFRQGKIEIKKDEKNFFIIQNLENGKQIQYQEPKAHHKRVMDKCNDKETRTKIQMFMGSLGNIGIDGVDKLNTRDLGVLEVLGNVFLLA